MIRLFTSVGRYELRKNNDGCRYPVVILKNKEYLLGIPEMILWSGLMWQIHTYGEMKAQYEQKLVESGAAEKPDIDAVLEELEEKGLIVSGRDYAGIDALYNLVSKLYIVPITGNFITKTGAFLHMTFVQKIPFSTTKKIFKRDLLTYDERLVLRLAKQTMLSTAELIKCVHRCQYNLSSDKKVLDTLYDDDFTTCDNIDIPSKYYHEQKPVLQAVSNLYLKKMIIFETL